MWAYFSAILEIRFYEFENLKFKAVEFMIRSLVYSDSSFISSDQII